MTDDNESITRALDSVNALASQSRCGVLLGGARRSLPIYTSVPYFIHHQFIMINVI